MPKYTMQKISGTKILGNKYICANVYILNLLQVIFQCMSGSRISLKSRNTLNACHSENLNCDESYSVIVR